MQAMGNSHVYSAKPYHKLVNFAEKTLCKEVKTFEDISPKVLLHNSGYSDVRISGE